MTSRYVLFFICFLSSLSIGYTHGLVSCKNCDIVSYELPKRNLVIQFAKDYIGTKYKYSGKSPKGFDCSGFVQYVFRNFGYHFSGSSKSMINIGRKKKIKDVQIGDLIFFARSKKVFHVAIVISNDDHGIKVIHSTSSKGVRIDNVSNSPFWKDKLYTAREVIL